jgi:hypothetical protein
MGEPMRTYGVICSATGFIAYVGHAVSPEDACIRATKDTGAWGTVGPFQRSIAGPSKGDDQAWLELSVYDVTGRLGPMPNVDIEDEVAMAAMIEDTHIDQFIARQY